MIIPQLMLAEWFLGTIAAGDQSFARMPGISHTVFHILEGLVKA